MKKQRRRHSEEFKKEVIEYSLNSSKSIAQICRDFNISASQFYAWKTKILGCRETAPSSKIGPNSSGEPSLVDLADEVRRLRKELAQSHRREDILKKAALILGTDPQNNMS
jgi:transposase-like protein